MSRLPMRTGGTLTSGTFYDYRVTFVTAQWPRVAGQFADIDEARLRPSGADHIE